EAPPEEQPPSVRANAIAGTRSNFGVALNMVLSWGLLMRIGCGGDGVRGSRSFAVEDHIGIRTII
ncbi:MAG: hypothetical protein M3536_10305, partial [Actinomycetota bacterium]|nr:hypothetical protein [Actinomycetota bacterium]